MNRQIRPADPAGVEAAGLRAGQLLGYCSQLVEQELVEELGSSLLEREVEVDPAWPPVAECRESF